MSLRTLRLVCSALLILGVWLPADAGETLEDVVNAPVPSRLDGSHLAPAEVQTAIVRACFSRHWVPRIEPGKVTASILVRGRHYAEVAIPFNENTYSILYVSSRNLDFEDHRGRREIHGNYIRWVGFLNDEISENLAIRAGQPAPPAASAPPAEPPPKP